MIKKNTISEQTLQIIEDFKGKTKNRAIKINFLKKLTKTDLYVSKKTGFLIPGNFYKKKKNLFNWEKKYKKKLHSSLSEHFSSRHLYVLKFLEKNLDIKNKVVADLGCGDAGLVTLLSKLYDPKKIYAFEASNEIFSQNKRRIKDKKIEFVNCDIESIDDNKFEKKFDIIFLTWTLSSCSSPLDILKKVFKILKYGGYIVVAESSRILVTPKNSIYYYFPKKYNTFLIYPFRFSFNSLSNLLTINNLKVVYKNNYEFNDNLVVIAKKTNFKKKFRFDNYKKIINFFKDWKYFSDKFYIYE